VEETRTCTLDNYPKELQKKVVLLQHFKSHLEGESAGKVEFLSPKSLK